MKKDARIVASVLAPDDSRLGREVADLTPVGVDAIRWVSTVTDI